MKLRTTVLLLAIASLLAFVSGGYLYFTSLMDFTLNKAHQKAITLTKETAYEIDAGFVEHQKSAAAMAGISELRALLENESKERLEETNATLDLFQDSLRVSVCYLMDRKGKTIASSNRDAPRSFVGKNYGFRPYFKSAIQGNPSIYMALGVTSRKRGVYFSHPVYNASRTAPIGVAVIKDSVKEIDKVVTRAHEGTMILTSPAGIIFACNKREWLYHFLWNPTPDAIERVKASQQFGRGPWKWTLVKRVGENRARNRTGMEYRIHEAEIPNYPGWKVTYLHDVGLVKEKLVEPLFRSTGMVILIFLMIAGYFVFFLYRQATEEIKARARLEKAQQKTILELQKAMNEIKTLEGILPICSYCKKIRDDKGYWEQVDTYVRERSKAEFSHSICPDCMKKYYPEEYESIMKEKD